MFICWVPAGLSRKLEGVVAACVLPHMAAAGHSGASSDLNKPQLQQFRSASSLVACRCSSAHISAGTVSVRAASRSTGMLLSPAQAASALQTRHCHSLDLDEKGPAGPSLYQSPVAQLTSVSNDSARRHIASQLVPSEGLVGVASARQVAHRPAYLLSGKLVFALAPLQRKAATSWASAAWSSCS